MNILIDKNEMELIQERLAAQIMENHPGASSLRFVGIQRRGVDLARRLAKVIKKKINVDIPTGSLDINLYRDDWAIRVDGNPSVSPSSIPFSVDGQTIILVDDVLFSGRTVRAALEALLDYGRPDCVELLTLIDRGHRELPICPTYTGRKIDIEKNKQVDVFFEEQDGRDIVCISTADNKD